MSEHNYDDHDTQPIKLPRARRSSFRDVPPPPPAWSREWTPAKQSIFETIDPHDVDGIKRFESLAVDDIIQVPIAIHDEHNPNTPAELGHEQYTVHNLGYSPDGYQAKLLTDAGDEETIYANHVNEGSLLEARVAETLLKRDGLDVRGAAALTGEDDPLNPDRDK